MCLRYNSICGNGDFDLPCTSPWTRNEILMKVSQVNEVRDLKENGEFQGLTRFDMEAKLVRPFSS